MKARKWTHGTIGSVSSGTMRAEDLIPAFASELRWLGHRSKELTRIEKASVQSATGILTSKQESYYRSEDAYNDLDWLFDALNSHALPYMYFGSHPGDGADYGFWISNSIDYDFEGLRVEDTSEVPAKHTGEVIYINDHGNMTLYTARRGKLTEVWAVV